LTKLPRDVLGHRAVKALEKIGWTVKTIRGSHHHLSNEETEEIITIPCHPQPLSPRILLAAIKLARLTIDEFKDLL